MLSDQEPLHLECGKLWVERIHALPERLELVALALFKLART